MTVAAALLPRRLGSFAASGQERTFVVDAETSLRAACHWHPDRASRGVLVLVHGLAGDAGAPYMLGTAAKAWGAGLHVVRLNMRNCGGTAALTRRHYHGGITEDLLAVCRELAEHDGIPRLHLAGFSLGGNHVLLLAARLGGGAPSWLRSIGTVCPCVDFDAAVRRIDGPGLLYRAYRRRFLAGLLEIARERARLDGEPPDTALARCRGLRDFDARLTAPRNGFRDVDDYYRRASARARLGEIRVPALLVASRDDPLVPFETLGDRELRANHALRLLVTERGGHLGFLARRREPDRRWAESRLVEFASHAEDA